MHAKSIKKNSTRLQIHILLQYIFKTITIISQSYGAVKKKSSHDAIESVLITMEYSRIMRKAPMIIAPKDATGCFDLLHTEAIRPIQESKGMPSGINAYRIKVLQGMECIQVEFL